jgi:uncharacterized membrane protein (UPF0127 family)
LKSYPFNLKECPAVKKVTIAKTFFQRARGLIGTRSLPEDEGMLIEKCNAIHTFFMSFPIDAYFLDNSNNVVKTIKNIKPWTFFIWGGLKAKKVLEIHSTNDHRTQR